MRARKTVSTSFAVALLLAHGAPSYAEPAATPERGAIAKRLYLTSNGKANTANGDGVLGWGPSTREVTDRYAFDPKAPVPQNPSDAASDRRDVLVYSTAVLERELQASGPVTVELYAASDARDTGFTAAIEDVQPDGKVVLLGSKPLAGPSSLTPGKAGFYRTDLDPIAHAFLPGHRIRLEISSSAASNEGNVANQRVWHDIAHPSALVLPVAD